MTIAFNSTTESGFIKADFDQISAYLSGADDSTTLEARLDGVDTTVSNLTTTVNNNKTLAEKDTGLLGEVKQFALSLTGAVTKATLQSKGWAICDGTTPASQGIADATITTTPDLRERFLRHSADETTGGTGGASTVTLDVSQIPAHTHNIHYERNTANSSTSVVGGYEGANGTATTQSTGGGLAHENKPPYYDICYFIKVKVI